MKNHYANTTYSAQVARFKGIANSKINIRSSFIMSNHMDSSYGIKGLEI